MISTGQILAAAAVTGAAVALAAAALRWTPVATAAAALSSFALIVVWRAISSPCRPHRPAAYIRPRPPALPRPRAHSTLDAPPRPPAQTPPHGGLGHRRSGRADHPARVRQRDLKRENAALLAVNEHLKAQLVEVGRRSAGLRKAEDAAVVGEGRSGSPAWSRQSPGVRASRSRTRTRFSGGAGLNQAAGTAGPSGPRQRGARFRRPRLRRGHHLARRAASRAPGGEPLASAQGR